MTDPERPPGPLICGSCDKPINPQTGECRCSA